MKNRENKFDEAINLGKLAQKTGNLFEMVSYISNSSLLCTLVELKDKEKCIKLMKEIFYDLENISVVNSKLYEHITFKNYNLDGIKFMLKMYFEQDDSLDFLREEKEFIDLMKKL